MTILPFPPRRGWLRGFLIVGTGTLAVAVVAVAVLVTTRAAVALVPIAVVVVVGWRRPSILVVPYRVWLAMAVRVERLVSAAVLTIAYGTVIVPASWTRAGIVLERPAVGHSLWEPYPPTDRKAYLLPRAGAVNGGGGAGWAARYVRWASTSDEAWLVGLLPFLWLLSKLDTRSSRGEVPTDIYTLA